MRSKWTKAEKERLVELLRLTAWDVYKGRYRAYAGGCRLCEEMLGRTRKIVRGNCEGCLLPISEFEECVLWQPWQTSKPNCLLDYWASGPSIFCQALCDFARAIMNGEDPREAWERIDKECRDET